MDSSSQPIVALGCRSCKRVRSIPIPTPQILFSLKNTNSDLQLIFPHFFPFLNLSVNLGGLFVLEPFISPSLFQKYQNLSFAVEDEWTLSLAMANDTASGGLQGQLESHYDTFIVSCWCVLMFWGLGVWCFGVDLH